MTNLFTYTGIAVWTAAALFVAYLVMLGVYHKIYKNSWLDHRIDILMCQITLALGKLPTEVPIPYYDAMKERLKVLELRNSRRFEQRFLKKYMQVVKVYEQESVFG